MGCEGIPRKDRANMRNSVRRSFLARYRLTRVAYLRARIWFGHGIRSDTASCLLGVGRLALRGGDRNMMSLSCARLIFLGCFSPKALCLLCFWVRWNCSRDKSGWGWKHPCLLSSLRLACWIDENDLSWKSEIWLCGLEPGAEFSEAKLSGLRLASMLDGFIVEIHIWLTLSQGKSLVMVNLKIHSPPPYANSFPSWVIGSNPCLFGCVEISLNPSR